MGLGLSQHAKIAVYGHRLCLLFSQIPYLHIVPRPRSRTIRGDFWAFQGDTFNSAKKAVVWWEGNITTRRFQQGCLLQVTVIFLSLLSMLHPSALSANDLVSIKKQGCGKPNHIHPKHYEAVSNTDFKKSGYGTPEV